MCTRILSQLSFALVSIVFPSEVRNTQGLHPQFVPDVNQSRILIFSWYKTIPKFQVLTEQLMSFIPALRDPRTCNLWASKKSRRPSVPFLGPNATGSQESGDKFPWDPPGAPGGKHKEGLAITSPDSWMRTHTVSKPDTLSVMKRCNPLSPPLQHGSVKEPITNFTTPSCHAKLSFPDQLAKVIHRHPQSPGER